MTRQRSYAGRDRSKRAAQEWILRALDGGAGQAHKVANKANALPELRLIFKETTEQGSEFVTDPYRVAMHHAAPWATEWECNDLHKFSEELRALVITRLAHLEDAGDFARSVDLSPKAIRRACRSFPARTAIGLDHLHFRDIAILPDTALEDIGRILRDAINSLEVHVQNLISMMVLLGKKNGGSSTIAILSTFYRLLMKLLSGHITEWDLKAAGHWDTAVRCSSALRAAIARCLDLELSAFEGLFVVHFLWDLRKFYDSVRITKLIDKLTALGYPPQVMVLGLLAHKGPRTLMVGTPCSDNFASCGRSILAGCQQSVSWARGLMHNLV